MEPFSLCALIKGTGDKARIGGHGWSVLVGPRGISQDCSCVLDTEYELAIGGIDSSVHRAVCVGMEFNERMSQVNFMAHVLNVDQTMCSQKPNNIKRPHKASFFCASQIGTNT